MSASGGDLGGAGAPAWISWASGGGAGPRHVGVAVAVTAVAGIALAAAIIISSRRGSLKSPWSRRKRKNPLTRQQWDSFFTPEGRLEDGGIQLLRKVRAGGIDPSIRAEVWPFLLGVFDLKSSQDERDADIEKKRKEYEKLRRQCEQLLKIGNLGGKELKEIARDSLVNSPPSVQGHDSLCFIESPSTENKNSVDCSVHKEVSASHLNNEDEENKSGVTHVDESAEKSESSDGESTAKEVPENTAPTLTKSGVTLVDESAEKSESSGGESTAEEVTEGVPVPTPAIENTDPTLTNSASTKRGLSQSNRITEDFDTWQRIIHLDAIRANGEWIEYAPAQAAVSEDKARKFAVAVGLKDYDHLEPCRIYHASRLVAVLEAYALYDPEIGYCQGMSDLLSPILAVVEQDHEAFWCFVGFMRKARHNFRLDEVGIRRQLGIVSKIIKSKDLHLYRHLEKLQAEDCFFVYRMVIVMFRRELNFDQTLSLWEVMWADQIAVRSGIAKSAFGWITMDAPPTEDLLLYAIAASVLQRRKLIIEKYSGMDEIIRECNSMAGQLDVWKLLDDAHNLVATLHGKIQ